MPFLTSISVALSPLILAALAPALSSALHSVFNFDTATGHTSDLYETGVNTRIKSSKQTTIHNEAVIGAGAAAPGAVCVTRVGQPSGRLTQP
ncbi:hypothetical protein EVAR_66146_1 [Eumeta japonica]|uniref:Uncharacterized protein n=1 Tax=Eumeta variegata TaxID=151549 RepID=A0A4C1Z1X7_EUMVA|nr:hypothetical protein EVAR_66146_1 [Eumeta japonica]